MTTPAAANVHVDLPRPAILIYWLRNECNDETWFSDPEDLMRRYFSSWFNFYPAFVGVAGCTIPTSPRVDTYTPYPDWLRKLISLLYQQMDTAAGLTRDVVLDTLLDIAYPVEVDRHRSMEVARAKSETSLQAARGG